VVTFPIVGAWRAARMRQRLRGVIGLDSVMPTVLVVAAVLMTLEPTIGGVSISDRQIVLAFPGPRVLRPAVRRVRAVLVARR
jgi:hypothetical protein